METTIFVGAAIFAAVLLRRRTDTEAAAAAAPQVSVRCFNLLSAGYDGPFRYYVPAAVLDWQVRRRAVLAALLAPAPGGGGGGGLPPDLLCVQELQSSTRGWGRLSGGDESADHAAWLRLTLGHKGYAGAYANTDHDPRSSKSDAGKDAPLATRKLGKDEWHEWPVPTACGLGARLGVALFWRRATWAHVATREVVFSTHFHAITKEVGNKAAWMALGSAHVALLALLRHRATGALLLLGTVHMPLPAFKSPNPDARQAQFVAALAAEVDALLEPLGLAGRVPVLITGDFNSKPGTPAHALLTAGALPEGALHSTVSPPYPASTTFAPFTSAYAAAGGGAEPDFTTFRLCRNEETGKDTAPFIGCLDYILARNPRAAATEMTAPDAPPRARLELLAVDALPSLDSLRAGSTGAMPSDVHPSDHLPIAATYTLRID